ncbi:MAG TPA: efflux RND transporter periplasmic adaptor subunit [Bryobacteraceae bacterium]|jgi:HlyD family secretion protein|nr:efflux RND transporter periplasmic adaptor subunit [Bryobacteraceae bacterium]
MAMDVKREGVAKKKMIKRIIYLTLTAGAVAVISWRLSLLKPAAPTVERATVWIDQVKRGPMLRQVRGLGTLVPEEIRWIPTAFDGSVQKVLVHSGEKVNPDTILCIISNPDMEVAANDLDWQVRQAEANFRDLKVRLESQRLAQKSIAQTTKSDMEQAKLTKERDEQLLELNLKSNLEVKLSVGRFNQLAAKYEIDKESLEIMSDSIAAQLDSARVQVDKLKAQAKLKRDQVAQLTVKADLAGLLQEMTLQVGQRVKPGDVLAKVAQPWKLKAELKIAETQAKDILLGQPVEIDTRSGVIPGHVSRIDPNVINGTRTVDCKLDGPLPPGAVPDLSVDGTVEIEKLADVVYVGRPVFGQPNSSVGLFKLEEDGKGASRVTVKLGRTSVNTIEILEGLKVGDQVVLSDMSAQDQHPRIRLN